MALMSPGVEVNEIDLSIVVPMLGNATAAFAGVFTKGPSDKFLLITNPEELIKYYGYPTNSNYNDWYQAYNFLQYANKLLISRSIDSVGTFKDSGNTVYAVNELGKVEIANAPTYIQIGSVIKFNANQENEYKVSDIEAPTEAVAQVDTLTINSVADTNIYTVSNRGQEVSYTANSGDTTNSVAVELGNLIEAIDTNATNVSVTGNVITVTASIAGISMNNLIVQGDITLNTIVENVEGESYELVFEDVNGVKVDFTEQDIEGNIISGADIGSSILVRYKATNALGTVPKEGSIAKTASELKPEATLIKNEEEYEIIEMSIPVTGDTKLKFIAKSSGELMNGIEVAVARESDFSTGTQFAFNGILLNDLFETKPLESKKEVAIIIRKDEKITGSYIVSLVPGSKDYRNKSNYIEDVINKYDELVYVKDNTSILDMPDSRLYNKEVVDTDGNIISPVNNKIIYLSNGEDGFVSVGDIENAYGSVSNNTIFGKNANKKDSSPISYAA